MNHFALSNAALFMSHRVSQKEIDKVVDRLDILPSEDFDITDAEEVRVAAVQLLLRRYSSLSDYITDINRYVADAVNRRAKLVCFPAYAGMLPATFLPQFSQTLKSLQPRGDTGLPDTAAFGSALTYYSDAVFDAFTNTMSALAARHRIWIMAGSVLYFAQDHLRHRALLFDSTGAMVGYQDKLALSAFERELGVEPGGELKILDSPLGPVSLLTCEDANYYEIARVARGLGARVLLSPSAFSGEYTAIRTALGLNMRVQESRMWGIQSVLVGDTGFGFAAEGCSCVFAPVMMTASQNGVLARSSGQFEPDVLCAPVSGIRLNLLEDPYREDCNPAFLKNCIDRLI